VKCLGGHSEEASENWPPRARMRMGSVVGDSKLASLLLGVLNHLNNGTGKGEAMEPVAGQWAVDELARDVYLPQGGNCCVVVVERATVVVAISLSVLT
jgi:hypothetical protein